jgi:hypothetical protein
MGERRRATVPFGERLMEAGGGRGPQWLRAAHLGKFAVLTLPGIGMAQQAMPGKKLTGSSAWLKLVGNTVTGKVDGKERSESHMDNGTANSLEDSRYHTGKRMRRAQACVSTEGQCRALEAIDAAAVLSSRTQATYSLTIQKESAEALSAGPQVGHVAGGDRCGKPAQRKELHQAAAATISDQLETCSAATSFHRGPEARKT